MQKKRGAKKTFFFASLVMGTLEANSNMMVAILVIFRCTMVREKRNALIVRDTEGHALPPPPMYLCMCVNVCTCQPHGCCRWLSLCARPEPAQPEMKCEGPLPQNTCISVHAKHRLNKATDIVTVPNGHISTIISVSGHSLLSTHKNTSARWSPYGIEKECDVGSHDAITAASCIPSLAPPRHTTGHARTHSTDLRSQGRNFTCTRDRA